MSELMLVNPRKRRKSRRKGPRKMSALQAKYFGGGGKRRKSGRRKTRRTARAAGPVARRVRRSARKARRAVRRFASNRSGSFSLKPNIFIKETLIPSAIGGAGALLVDVAWGAIPFIPANLKTGALAPLVKGAAAVAIGLAASKVAGKKIGGQVVSGYLTVLAYNMLKGMVQKAMPSLPMGDYDLGYVQGGTFVGASPADPSINVGMNAYLTSDGPQNVGAYLNEYDNSYNSEGYH